MGAKILFSGVIKLLKRFTLKTKISKEIHFANESNNSKFTLIRKNILAEKRASNSLLFQMYSSENEELFV